MNIISIKAARPTVLRSPRPQTAPRLTGVWARNPRTGRLEQVWRLADDADGSCSGRPCGPLDIRDEQVRLRRAA